MSLRSQILSEIIAVSSGVHVPDDTIHQRRTRSGLLSWVWKNGSTTITNKNQAWDTYCRHSVYAQPPTHNKVLAPTALARQMGILLLLSVFKFKIQKTASRYRVMVVEDYGQFLLDPTGSRRETRLVDSPAIDLSCLVLRIYSRLVSRGSDISLTSVLKTVMTRPDQLIQILPHINDSVINWNNVTEFRWNWPFSVTDAIP